MNLAASTQGDRVSTAGGMEAMPAPALADVCRAWLQCSPDGVLLLAADGRIEAVNDAARALLEPGGTEDVRGLKWAALWPVEERPKIRAAAAGAVRGRTVRFQAASASGRSWDVVVAPVTDRDQRAAGLLVLFRDMSEVREHDRRGAQARRLEAMGRLTSAVAHDFNNLLTVVMSANEAAMEAATDDERRALAELSLEAAERGAEMVRRLLSLSGRRAPAQPVDCRSVLDAVSAMCRATLSDGVELTARTPQALLYCQGERAELESALLNLCLNARDAMPDGGRLELSVERTRLDAAEAETLDLPAGDYAVFLVQDNGVGMTPAVLERAAEPFFTTKGRGGSGLGLSSADGFARRFGGRLSIASRPGEGAAVRLYLPAARRAAQAELALTAPARPTVAGARVLLVDADEAVRGETARGLNALDCIVVEAADAGEALRRLAGGPLDLLITELGACGGASGRELAAMARLVRPSLKVLFTCAGHADAAGEAVLAKPYRRAQLAEAVEEALSRYDAGAARPRKAVRRG